MMALPGRSVLKKVKSSCVTLQKGRLGGGVSDSDLGPSLLVCSVRRKEKNTEGLQMGNNRPRRTKDDNMSVGEVELWKDNCVRGVLSLKDLWKIPTIANEV